MASVVLVQTSAAIQISVTSPPTTFPTSTLLLSTFTTSIIPSSSQQTNFAAPNSYIPLDPSQATVTQQFGIGLALGIPSLIVPAIVIFIIWRWWESKRRIHLSRLGTSEHEDPELEGSAKYELSGEGMKPEIGNDGEKVELSAEEVTEELSVGKPRQELSGGEFAQELDMIDPR